jgi:hypothetical protein
MQDKLLCIRSVERYRHYMQMLMEFVTQKREVDDGEIEMMPYAI